MPDLTVEMAVEAVNEVLAAKRQRFDEVMPETVLAVHVPEKACGSPSMSSKV